jgi:hypothetical protein
MSVVTSSVISMNDDLSDLDPAGLLAALSAATRARRLAEVQELVVLATWAAAHSGDPEIPRDELVQLGGEGTPLVQEFGLGESALARGTGVTATVNAMADTLDLIHRLPQVWAVCVVGDADLSIARRVAKLSRHLPADRVGVVDRAIARVIGHVSGGRVLVIAEAKIIEADPALHEKRVEAIVSRVAEILAPRYPDAAAGELRSIAFGWLARPAELLDALREVDLTPLAPKAVLYVHLHEAAVLGAGGVARVEGLGPVTLTGLQALLARTSLVIKPVLDLSDRVRTTAYEHRESLKERVHLTTGGDYWPYATSTSRNVDYDHPIPFDDTGPPGQTGTHNSGPLGRRHHRYKTHAGYRARQCGQGRYVWLTPHGLGFLVDSAGTRRISEKHALMILDAPPGVDIYPGVRLELARACRNE